jgi:diguanylate cyclase (GGDEF)-like protein
MSFLTNFEKRSKFFSVTVGFVFIGVISLIDFLTGYELTFSAFYVIPISFITWFNGRRLGLMTMVACAFLWISADIATGHPYSHPFVQIWNYILRIVAFVLVTWLLSALRSAAEHERELSRTDHLTGAANSRFFHQLMRKEIDRLQRYGHPFTLAYFDLDNFKNVNDQFGHSIGDQVLCSVVTSARKYLRKTDVVARLGGDEFAFLLPETNQASARIVLSKIQGILLEEMRQNNRPITFSMGVLTCNAAPDSIDELISIADELMYSVKRGMKNAVNYAIYNG